MAAVKTLLLWSAEVRPAPTRTARYPLSQPNGKGKSAGAAGSPAARPPWPPRPARASGPRPHPRTGVGDRPHGPRNAASQHGVEQLDDEDQAGAEDEQGGSQQDEAHRQVCERMPANRWWPGGTARLAER